MQTSAFGTSAAASACQSLRKPRIAGGEPSAAERNGQRCDADAAADEQRPLDVEVEAVPERAEHVQLVAGLERAERTRAGPDRIDQEGELAARPRGRGSSAAAAPGPAPRA